MQLSWPGICPTCPFFKTLPLFSCLTHEPRTAQSHVRHVLLLQRGRRTQYGPDQHRRDLGRSGLSVLVIDLDLERLGIPTSTKWPDASPSEQKPRQRPLQPGFVDLLIDAKLRGQEADLFAMSVGELANRYTQAYHVPEDLLEFKDGSLHIMPAGKFDGNYAQRFDDLNLHVLYEQGLGEP